MGKVAGGGKPLTYDDYVLIPDDGMRHEIIQGQHYVTPSPFTRHQRISRRIHHQLYEQIELQQLGEVYNAPTDLVLADTDIIVPDLLVVLNENRSIITEKNIRGAPDLVVEITSPSTRSRDLGIKRDLCERHRVPEYWIVLTEEDAVLKLVLEDGVYRDCGRFSDRIELSGLDGVVVDLTRVW